jgi:hypothetical protein
MSIAQKVRERPPGEVSPELAGGLRAGEHPLERGGARFERRVVEQALAIGRPCVARDLHDRNASGGSVSATVFGIVARIVSSAIVAGGFAACGIVARIVSSAIVAGGFAACGGVDPGGRRVAASFTRRPPRGRRDRWGRRSAPIDLSSAFRVRRGFHRARVEVGCDPLEDA